MSILKIYQYPAEVLRQAAKPVDTFDGELARLAKDMAETMYDAPGIGLAAPQIGVSRQLVVVDISRDPNGGREFLTLVNPEIIVHEGSQLDEEGCLSVPELIADVKRYKRITISYQDLDGQSHQFCTSDRFAVVLQHELDHLNGILFIDHLSPLKRNLYKKKVKKWLEEA